MIVARYLPRIRAPRTAAYRHAIRETRVSCLQFASDDSRTSRAAAE